MGKSKKKNSEEPHKINIEIVTREEWGAASPTKDLQLLKIPTKYIRYSWTNTKEDNCISLETCSQDLRDFQKNIMNEGYPDLPYNFLIGKDGRVYEGMGWYLDVTRHESLKKFKSKCLDISYMGEFSRALPPTHMAELAADLVESGINLKLIRELPRVETLNDFRDYCYYEDQER